MVFTLVYIPNYSPRVTLLACNLLSEQKLAELLLSFFLFVGDIIHDFDVFLYHLDGFLVRHAQLLPTVTTWQLDSLHLGVVAVKRSDRSLLHLRHMIN
jgi:NDP-sugar pyrophosphorylase family protein